MDVGMAVPTAVGTRVLTSKNKSQYPFSGVFLFIIYKNKCYNNKIEL